MLGTHPWYSGALYRDRIWPEMVILLPKVAREIAQNSRLIMPKIYIQKLIIQAQLAQDHSELLRTAKNYS